MIKNLKGSYYAPYGSKMVHILRGALFDFLKRSTMDGVGFVKTFGKQIRSVCDVAKPACRQADP
ncbi:hypothetical protein CSW08_13705 [Confluentibacter flavum]|uniref:Uncharacterized protein n=1 Tax=Confluentibacter flavum TaxID=1909700 RepID=A0A2N3HHL6_9FLAO|nr:hypothetical protein CSW08_13705 [Confluentibacter flavum]